MRFLYPPYARMWAYKRDMIKLNQSIGTERRKRKMVRLVERHAAPAVSEIFAGGYPLDSHVRVCEPTHDG